METIKRVLSVAESVLSTLFHSSIAKAALIALVGILGYRTFNPVPSRELIIREIVDDSRTPALGSQAAGSTVTPSTPSQYVVYTIVCIPIDRAPVCDTAAHTFRFLASPAAEPEARVAGQVVRMSLHRTSAVDPAGRVIYLLDLPAQVSGKEPIEITAPIFGVVRARDLSFESPTDGELLEKKMQCPPPQFLTGGGMAQLCVEIPSFGQRLAALFDFKLH